MRLTELLPEDYRKSYPVSMIQEALERQESRLEHALTEMEEQLFLDTATWGMTYWEGVYGTDGKWGRDLETRRSAVRGKMRGVGTATVKMIENVAEGIVGGDVRVAEYNEEYRFLILMISVIGIPPSMEELKRAIEEIKPAHLSYEIILRYNTWGMMEDAAYTWATAGKRTWADMKEVAL